MLILAKKEDILKKTAFLRSFLIFVIACLILSPLAPALAQEESSSVPADNVGEPLTTDSSLPVDSAPLFPTPSPAGNESSDPLPLTQDRFSPTFERIREPGATGAFSYDYPLVSPPGRGGIQPDLKLTYNSQDTAPSAFGFGWSINIPYIERINRYGLNRLYNENLFYSSLSGELANLGGSAYGAKVETGEFIKYEFADNRWLATDKKGVVYKFGPSADSRQDDPDDASRIFKWMLEEIRDKNDNFIKYEYYKYEGQIYPLKIVYTGHGQSNGIFSIDFSLAQRRDEGSRFETGFRVNTSRIVSAVTASVSGQWTRKYEFDYSAADNGKRSLLASIIESGRDEQGNAATLPATEFQYARKEVGWTENQDYKVPETFLTFPEHKDSGARLADINGDGLTDFLWYPRGMTSKPGEVYLNTGAGWRLDNRFTLPIAFYAHGGSSVRLVDVNADGLTDIMYANEDPGTIKKTWLNNGDGTWILNSDYIAPKPFERWTNDHRDYGVRLADINGDGLVDFLWYPQELINYRKGEVYLNTGSGWSQDYYNYNLPISFSDNRGQTRLVDLNADGLVDIMYGYDTPFAPNEPDRTTWINQGEGKWQINTNYKAPEVFWSYERDRDYGVQLADINGDGLVDFLWNPGELTGEKGGRVWLNTGTGWSENYYNYNLPIKLNIKNGATVRLDDINADGLVDIVHASSDTGHPPRATWLNSGPVPDLLIGIKHNKGASTSIEYQKSSRYQDGQGNLANPTLPFAITTVKQARTDDGLGNGNTTIYQYEQGYYYRQNVFERKFAGFGRVDKTEQDRITKTYYHQGNGTNSSQGEFSDDIAKAGQAYRTEISDSNAKLYSLAIKKWQHFDLGSGRKFIASAQSLDLTYDGDAGHRDKAEAFVYDLSNGNLLEKNNWGEVSAGADGSFTDVGQDKIKTVVSYASGGDIIGLPAEEKTFDFSGVKIKQTRNYYDDLPLAQVSVGNVTRQEAWLNSNDSYIAVSRKAYNQYGLATSETDANNNSTAYQYDDYYLYPIAVTNALGQQTSNTYNYSIGKIKQTQDPNGVINKTTYDGLGRVVKKEISDQNQSINLAIKEQDVYDDYSFPTGVVKKEFLSQDAPVKETREYYDGFGRALQTRFTLDAAGQWSQRSIIYDSKGRVSKEYVPVLVGGGDYQAPSRADSQATQYQYDALDRVVKITTSLGDTATLYDDWTKIITDANSHPVKYNYDAFGRLTRVDEFNTGETYSTIYQYDNIGNLIKITDSESNVRNFTYNSLGQQLTNELPHKPGVAGAVHSLVYDAVGNKLAQTYPDSHQVNWTYDGLNRVLTQDEPSTPAIESINVYDTAANGIAKIAQTASGENSIAFEYDKQGNVNKETRVVSQAIIKEPVTYSIAGQVKYYDGAKAIVGAEVILEDGGGNKIASVLSDAAGNYQFNDLPAGDYASRAQKNDASIAVSIADIVKTVRHILLEEEFNSIYKKIAADTDQDGVILVTDVIKMVRRILGIENFPAGEWKFFNSDYVLSESNYLNGGRTRVYNNLASDFTAQDFIGLKVGDVNNSWRGGLLAPAPTPQKREPLYQDGAYTTEYLYDDYGALQKITYPDGTAIEYDYNILGKIKAVRKNNSPLVSAIAYGPHEKAESIAYANDVIQNFIYDVDKQYRLTGKTAQVSGSKLQDLSYAYDPVGNIMRIQDIGAGLPKDANYLYDDLNRLLRADISVNATTTSESYTYSPTGNILSKTGVGDYSYNDPRHPYAVTQAGNDVFAYDAAGNLTTETRAGEGIAYTYDYLNRLSSITNNTGLSTYIYGADSNRIQKRLADGSRLSYLGEYGEINEKGEYTDYFFADSDRVATSDLNGLFYNVDDHLSSASVLTDSRGVIAQKLDYFPFGSERVNEKTTSFSTRHTFTDQEKDSESGLLYYGARYYNPNLGRFTQIDPITLLIGQEQAFKAQAGRAMAVHLANPQNLNTYSYVLNNPLKYVDPDGEFWFLAPLLIAAPPVLAALTTALPYIPAYISNWQDTLRVAPGSSDIIDAQQFITGQDSFTGSQLSPLSRGFSGIGLLPFISGGMVKGAANVLPDAALVCRGGMCKADNFIKPGELKNGLLSGSSVNASASASLKELTESLKNSQFGQTTLGKIRALGGDIIPKPSPRNPYHADLNGITPQQAEKLFTPTMPNPNKIR